MASRQRNVAIPGSWKRVSPGAELVGELPDGEFSVTVTVRRRQPLPNPKHHQGQKLRDRIHMSHREQGLLYGAETGDLQQVGQFAIENGLRVVNSDPDRRMIVLSGTAAAYQQAFGVELKNYVQDGIHHRRREGSIFIPAGLEGIVTSVTGLDNRPFAKPHVRVRRPAARAAEAVSGGVPVSAVADAPKVSAGFSPAEIAALYDFPGDLNGAGQTIGILELAGGFSADEVQGYFGRLGIRSPKISVVP